MMLGSPNSESPRTTSARRTRVRESHGALQVHGAIQANRPIQATLLWATCLALALPGNLCCGLPGFSAACCAADEERTDRLATTEPTSAPHACCGDAATTYAAEGVAQPQVSRSASSGFGRLVWSGPRHVCCCIAKRSGATQFRTAGSDETEQDGFADVASSVTCPSPPERSTCDAIDVLRPPRNLQILLCRWRC